MNLKLSPVAILNNADNQQELITFCGISIPNEIVKSILSYLPENEIRNLSLLSKKFKILSDDLCVNLKPVKNFANHKLIQLFTRFIKATSINDDNFTLTDDHLAILSNLTNLDLSYYSIVTDAGIKHLTKLKNLNLNQNRKITNEGIKNLTNITELSLKNNDIITNAGIKVLTNLKDLNLYLNDVITDAGIKELTNLTRLNR